MGRGGTVGGDVFRAVAVTVRSREAFWIGVALWLFNISVMSPDLND
jgi:hypothetical protein